MGLVKRQFYWPRMDKDISDYVSSCQQCQANKTDRRNKTPPLTPLLPPDSCWKTIGVDLITDLPVTRSGEYNAVCVFVCHLSKMVRLIPTNMKLKTEGFAKLFFREVFPHYGFPAQIVSDRGKQWNAAFFKALCQKAGILLLLSTAYHAQTNGLVERYNEVVSAALRHYVNVDLTDWDDYLPFIEFALNSSYVPAIGTTPLRMNRVNAPRNPFTELVQASKGAGPTTPSSGLYSWMGSSTARTGVRTYLQAHAQFQRARKSVHDAKSLAKEKFDANLRDQPVYEPGQKVWLNIKNVAIRHPAFRGKLLPKYVGPLSVLKMVGRNAIKLDLPSSLPVHPTFSTTLVKPYLTREGAPEPLFRDLDMEPEWEVDRITSHKISSGAHPVTSFKVK